MSQKDGNEKASRGRRGFKIDGDDVQTTRAPKTRSIDEVLRLDREEAAPLQDGQRAFNPARIRAFLEGRITLGDLEGITKQEQYQMAEVGHSYLSSGKFDEAKTVFEGLLALDPFDAYFHTVLGSISQQNDDLEEAEKRYSRALEINPFFATAMANRGEIRVMQGRLTEGTEDLIKAVQADPQAKEPATVRAQATLKVLREKLTAAAKQAEIDAQREATKPGAQSGAAEVDGARRAAAPNAPRRAPEVGAQSGAAEVDATHGAPEVGAARRAPEVGAQSGAAEVDGARRAAAPNAPRRVPEVGAARRAAEPGAQGRAQSEGRAGGSDPRRAPSESRAPGSRLSRTRRPSPRKK